MFIFGGDMAGMDTVYEHLVSPSPEFDLITRQIFLTSFQFVWNRQLKDHLEDGRYSNNSSHELISEPSTVPRNNVGPERIFAKSDNLIRVMP